MIELKNRGGSAFSKLILGKCFYLLGLWLRAAMMKTRNKTVKFSCPMKFLSPLFSAHMYLPTRSIISLTFSLRDDSQILCVSKSDTRKYKTEVKDISLRLKYGTFYDRVQEKWENAIDQHGLRRNIQCDKTSYFVMKKGTKSARFQSIFSFSALPSVVICYFLKESTWLGNYSDNRFSFQDPGVRTIALFRNGVSHGDNEMTCDMDLSKNGFHHMFWYHRFFKSPYNP